MRRGKMTETEQRTAAKKFSAFWAGKGYEKGESQPFWLSLLRDVYGVDHPEQYITFEDQVHLDHTSFIDGMIPTTRVLIEQKGLEKDLKKPIKQSDGSLLTPFQQAKRYITELPVSQHPRWVITCNFSTFFIYDMEHPGGEPEILYLKDLEKEYHRLDFLVDAKNEHIQKEVAVSKKAGEIVGQLYDAFSKQYAEPNSEQTLKSLNKLCVRLVFCLYAEDAGIFGRHGMFHDYLEKFDLRQMRRALLDLFRILDTREENRDAYLKDDDPELAAFPYVNGGLFADENIEIPPFTEEIRTLLLRNASEDFNWSEISPTIFGAVFESTLNPETRRKGGMHYTSIENIHKVIDPLFLEDLKKEFLEISALTVATAKQTRLERFQNKLASLTFLDPACGSGNFLTETYLSLRRLENQTIAEMIAASREKGKAQVGGQIMMGGARSIDVKVSISQFYGIEINDFAVTVAKTALWIAESQMLKETEEIVLMHLDFLPLKTNAYIVEGNALRMDWASIVPKTKLSYIMGNPPFVGSSMMNKEQKTDVVAILGKKKLANSVDYVGAWYYKAASLIENTNCSVAFVSTNSITQGEQVAPLWEELFNKYNIHITFAYRTFRWDSEASSKAQVHCVIIGFSTLPSKKCKIYIGDRVQEANNINAYLVDAPNVFVSSRSKPICNVPAMFLGNKPSDGGNLILTEEERNNILQREPDLKQFIRPYLGAVEFINKKIRYCFWLKNASPSEIRKSPELMRRIEAVRNMRLASTAAPTREKANTPHLFFFISQPDTNYLLVPSTSSENRRYVPIGFLSPDVIASNAATIVPDATLYNFGVMTSNVHMAWMRTVCGRLKSDYRYSNAIVYNNFPWPTPTEAQKAKIEQTAQAILDARALYPDSSLADLYDEVTMPSELRKAHQQNDRAVMDAYGFVKGTEARTSESACVAELMKLYQKLVDKKK